MFVCSQNCGYTTENENERFCPDCGAAMQTNSGTAASAAITPTPAPATAPIPAPPMAPPMPALPGGTANTLTVLYSIGLPYEDAKGKKTFDLVEGGTFTVRRKLTDEEIADQGGAEQPADFYVPRDKDSSVSASDPFVLSVKNGKLVAQGGGSNGFKVSWVQSFVAHPETELTMVPSGKPTMTIVVGAKTPFRVK